MRDRGEGLMIKSLVQIRTARDAFLASFAITAAVVMFAMALTVLATWDCPPATIPHAIFTAGWISFVIGAVLACWFVSSVRAIVRLKDTVDRLARTDDLTGLENRRSFLAAAEREMLRAGSLALLVLDLDDFKRINDTHGHHVGDLVLVGVAGVLAQSVRPGADVVGRVGGEEFAVLLPGRDEEDARRAAEAIRRAVEIARIATPAGEIAATVSVGCASITKEDSVSTALQKADDALYAAKRGGRNRVAAYVGRAADLRQAGMSKQTLVAMRQASA
jgi:diguanylate cyclase (GGDEF)-like protein